MLTTTTTWRARSCLVIWRTPWRCAAWPGTKWPLSAGRSNWSQMVRNHVFNDFRILTFIFPLFSFLFFTPYLSWHYMLLFPPCFPLKCPPCVTLNRRVCWISAVSVAPAVRGPNGGTADRNCEEKTPLRQFSSPPDCEAIWSNLTSTHCAPVLKNTPAHSHVNACSRPLLLIHASSNSSLSNQKSLWI